MEQQAPQIDEGLGMAEFRLAKHVGVVGLAACELADSRMGVRRLGELDQEWDKVWSSMFKDGRERGRDNSLPQKCAEMSSIWDRFLEEKQSCRGLLSKLKETNDCFVEKIHDAAMAGLKEVDELMGHGHGHGKSFPKLRSWNLREDREATVPEVIQHFAGILCALSGKVEALVHQIEEQNRQVQMVRDQPFQVALTLFQVPEEAALSKEPQPYVVWRLALPFSHLEAMEFRAQRAMEELKTGLEAQMLQAEREAFAALLKYGSRSAIGVRELGYMNLPDHELQCSNMLARYQKADFPHHMQGSCQPDEVCEEDDELQGMAGVRVYPSEACARKEMKDLAALQTSCSDCKVQEYLFPAMVFCCRKCLSPQAWNYKLRRRATLSETIAYLIAAILYRQNTIKTLEFVVRIQGEGLQHWD